MEKREKFGSRLGFVLVSAGCAIGLGNVWKFPYMCGKNGGAIFILIYLLFLLMLGLPIMICEFAVGRASRKSCASSFRVLEPKNTRWHHYGYLGMVGNYLLMMFYTMVAGWLLYYFYRSAMGEFTAVQLSVQAVDGKFDQMLQSPFTMIFWTVLAIVLSFGICAMGLKNGVEKITKAMMICLILLIVVLAVNSVLLPGAEKGLKFYLVPDLKAAAEIGWVNVIFNAMSQAFFTLSVGMGSMAIFGSYLDKDRSLTGESITITVLDTFVALMAGLIIIPACLSFGIEPDAGPSLIFKTLPNIFNQMPGGRIWGTLFFLFMSFAALSTVTAVFENILSFAVDLWGWSRRKAIIFNIVAIALLSMPCVLGFNVLSGIQPLGAGTNILDMEDFLVSSNILPIGSIVYVMFCTCKNGWGFDSFIAEADSGKGMKFPRILKNYMRYILPLVVIVIYLKGYWDTFSSKGIGYLVGWNSFALLLLALTAWIVFSKKK